MNNVIAVDIGGTHFRVGLFDEAGRRLLVSENATLPAGGREWVLEQVRDHCRRFAEKSDYPVKACGMSFGGLVDSQCQRVTSVHFAGWKDFALADWMWEMLGVPCRLENDANAGALGEYTYGAGRGLGSLFYVTLSAGIGGGWISEGKIIRGRDGLAGEIGHLPVSDTGVLCSCGARGCLETFCSGEAIARRGQEWAGRRSETRMIELSGGAIEDITAKAVIEAAAQGDMAAERILREAGRWLARALLMVIRLLNPDKIVLGGGVAQAGNLLLDPVNEAIGELKSPTIGFSTAIVLAELGTLSPLYGAAVLAREAAGTPV
ncbi:MAG: ROK family protein [Acidobacteriia bacterium]|nr:ROK family protein [Terriglobia bacterium]